MQVRRTAPWPHFVTCSACSTTRTSRSSNCPSIPPISMTCSSPSPAIRPRRLSPCHDNNCVHPRRFRHHDARNVRRLLRYPSMTLLLVGMPIVLLLLFVYVFGGQLSHGLGSALAGGHVGRDGYLNYVAPGILLLTVAAAVQGTAIVVAMDMTGGIIDRFRTMAIARSSVLTGHVLAALIQTMAGLAIVIGFAVALGFRPTAGVVAWLATIGMLGLFAFALVWLATALGLAAKSVETASNTPMFLMLLVSSAAVSYRPARCRPVWNSSPATSPSRR